MEDISDLPEVVLLEDLQGHVVVVVVDGLLDFIVDYNLIFFIPQVQENTPFVSAFSFSHEIFAILHSSKQNSESRTKVSKRLNKKINTRRATAAGA